MVREVVKLNLIHKQIMFILASEFVQKAGELTEGWKKENHIQHTEDTLNGRRKVLQRMFDNTKFEDADQNDLKRFRDMLIKDLKNTIFNLQNDRLPEGLVSVAKDYCQQMKDMIDVLNVAID